MLIVANISWVLLQGLWSIYQFFGVCEEITMQNFFEFFSDMETHRIAMNKKNYSMKKNYTG